MKIVFLVLFFAVCAVHLAASFLDKQKIRYATKAFILLFLLLYYVFAAEKASGIMTVALITSLVGDIFLMPSGIVFFAVGGASFLASQVLFILQYSAFIDFSNVNTAAVCAVAVLYFAAAVFAFKKLKAGMDTKTFFGAAAYLAVNGAMNLFAFMLLLSMPCFGSALVLFGAAAFYVSDILLFFNDFYVCPLKRKYFLVMLTYCGILHHAGNFDDGIGKVMSEYYDELYALAYKILGDKTPLGRDCGVLCEKSCCKGDDKTGMLLFPFEKSPLKITESKNFRLAVCGGECKRNTRPLSCRLFPFFPCVDEKGNIKVRLDFRGFSVCPLVKNAKDVRFSQRFLNRVKKVGELLSQDEACVEFLKEISKEIEFEKRLLE